MTRTYRGAALLALALVLLLPGTAQATSPTTRHHHVVKGLDWLHTRQRSTGGFSYLGSASSPYDTPWAMLAIAAGNNGPSRWKKSGKNPVAYLQSIDLTSAAGQSDNVPKYYALCILAYNAADRTDLIYSAGSGQIDLVNKLETYATTITETGKPDLVYFSPVAGSPVKSTETTGWAILALIAARQNGAKVSDALTWLQQKAVNQDGGFGQEPGSESTTSYTGLVLQALKAGAAGSGSSIVQGAVDFLRGQQATNGGFVDPTFKPDTDLANSLATAWAIEGLRASGEDPSAWVKTGSNGARHDPYSFLIARQLRNGSFHQFTHNKNNVMGSTMQATIALTGKFLPIALARNVTAHYYPWFRKGTVVPSSGATYKVRTVTVRAGYRDNENGTGINAKAVRVTVDGVPKTRAASVTASHLSLTLTKLRDGAHIVEFSIVDHAGNGSHTARKFTVAVPTPPPSPSPSATPPTGGGNTRPGGGTGGTGGTVVVPTSIPTTAPRASATPAQTTPPTAGIPGTTLTPSATPTYSPTPAPSPSSSVSGVVINSSKDRGGGSGGAGGVAAVIVALVVFACLAAYLVRRHLLGELSSASRGYVLQEGTSVWQRFWKPAGTPPARPRE